MNQLLISKYLQILRKKHGLTQEDLANELSISRQAISKWETANTLPDLDILLKLSNLYQVTINEILEPTIKTPHINSFEQIIELNRNEIKVILSNFTKEDIVKASMGTSPQVNDFLIDLYPEINFKLEQEKIGRIRVNDIEEIHNGIVSLINLSNVTISSH